MSEHHARRSWNAPDGFLRLDDTARQCADRLRCTRQKAEYRIAREVTDGRLRLIMLGGFEPVAVAEKGRPLDLDFTASEVYLPGGMLQLDTVTMQARSMGTCVVLDADDVRRLLDELAPPAASAVTVPAAPSYQAPAASAPRPPGRPASYDWPWYEAQVRRRVHKYGLPEKSSILVAEVLALFGRKIENPPEQRTVEREIAKWWPSLEDLLGPCEIIVISNSRPK